MRALDASLARARDQLHGLEIWLEPGRYVVAEAGVLLATVTQLKGKGDVQYVGVTTGMNSLIRPALYGAYHEIANLSRLGEAGSEVVSIVGPICETGDRLGSDRLLPATEEGDVLAHRQCRCLRLRDGLALQPAGAGTGIRALGQGGRVERAGRAIMGPAWNSNRPPCQT